MLLFRLLGGLRVQRAVVLYFICMEVFRSALSSLPGLLKFGVVIFRWAVLVSVIVTISSCVHLRIAAF